MLIDHSSTSYPRVERVFASHAGASEKERKKNIMNMKSNTVECYLRSHFFDAPAFKFIYSKFWTIRPISWVCFFGRIIVCNCNDDLISWNSNECIFNSNVFFRIHQVVPVEVGQLTEHVLPMTLNVPKCTIVSVWRQLNRCISSLTTTRTATSTWLNRMM